MNTKRAAQCGTGKVVGPAFPPLSGLGKNQAAKKHLSRSRSPQTGSRTFLSKVRSYPCLFMFALHVLAKADLRTARTDSPTNDVFVFVGGEETVGGPPKKGEGRRRRRKPVRGRDGKSKAAGGRGGRARRKGGGFQATVDNSIISPVVSRALLFLLLVLCAASLVAWMEEERGSQVRRGRRR